MLEKILGRPLFGKKDDGAILPWWWHSQNLDERPGDGYQASGSKFIHGRGWLHTSERGHGPTVHVSWNLRSTFCHLTFRADDNDHDLTVSVAFPPVAFWIGVEGLPKSIFKTLGVDYETVRHHRDGCYLMDREISVSVHGWSVWWNLWMPTMISHSGDPRWRRGCFNILDAVFGRSHFEKVQVAGPEAVLIPMPERNYRGTVTIEHRTWTRPRWPFRRGPRDLFYESLGYNLKMEDGEQIPYPGKGENSWDCGDDALFGQGGEGGVTQAIAGAVQSVLRSRQKYGGGIGWKPDPAPAAEAQA